ncbi:MAG: 30S ribosomal protein S4 [Deltaproteobacteria bacterium]|nr:30S ribosomal protein S4 [Candidatus Zymogenaceae bacterium]
MARYRGPVCKLCRRDGMKLYLKGDRCFSEKCAVERRNYPPGEHGQGRTKFSEYGSQLREKQKVKRMYGILENQFHLYFNRADRIKGITGENLLVLLERRLDNMVYRFGFATSRSEARQLVLHRHFLVNGKKVNIPSYLIKVGDTITLNQSSRKVERIVEALEISFRRGIPQWLEFDKTSVTGTVKAMPARKDLTMPISENLIVELYSK